MKKKLLLLLMTFVLVCSNFVVASAADYNFVTPTNAVAAVDKTTEVVIIDVRTKENYDKGHLKNSISMPLFDANGVTNGSDALATAFTASVEANKTTLDGKDIYILCNSGAKGAQHATALLIAAGYSNDDIFTITGGATAKGTEDKSVLNNLIFVSSDYAFNAVKAGGSLILDVRATDVYYEQEEGKGYIDKSLHQPLFTYNKETQSSTVTTYTDDLATKFNAFVAANKDTLTNNKVYILCNGGQSGAAAATYLLNQAGITGNVFTIEGGAKALYGREGIFVNQNFVSGTDAVAAIGNEKIVIMNVRAKANYDAGHLKGAVSYPVFDANGVTSGSDQLAKDFLAKVKANAASLDGKTIYLVCNGGASGAKAATKLLMQAGYSNSSIYTVTGGFKGTETDKSVAQHSTYVSADQALSVIGNEKYIILDVRAAELYADGHLKGSVSLPLFTRVDNKNVAVEAPYTDALSVAFTKYAQENKDALTAKEGIYILCNSGSKGAVNATHLLKEQGITANVYTIEGGATNESIQIAFNNTVTDKEALAAVGSDKVVIIDVRTKENYDKGHLKGSISMPLFDANGVTNGEDDLAKAFLAAVKANEAKLAGKDIYILCNSGARGAQAATKLLKAAGYSNDDIFTITGGAKNASIQAAFVKEAPKTGDMAPTMGYIVVMLAAAAVIMASKKKLAK